MKISVDEIVLDCSCIVVIHFLVKRLSIIQVALVDNYVPFESCSSQRISFDASEIEKWTTLIGWPGKFDQFWSIVLSKNNKESYKNNDLPNHKHSIEVWIRSMSKYTKGIICEFHRWCTILQDNFANSIFLDNIMLFEFRHFQKVLKMLATSHTWAWRLKFVVFPFSKFRNLSQVGWHGGYASSWNCWK